MYFRWYYMGVITVRIPDDLRVKMRRLNVNWSEEIRRFIAQRVEEEERRESVEEALRMLKGRRGVEAGFSAQSVREDRDSAGGGESSSGSGG
nr:hypothetical protein [Candidatus Freyrarchaeum guaymaensis]